MEHVTSFLEHPLTVCDTNILMYHGPVALQLEELSNEPACLEEAHHWLAKGGILHDDMVASLKAKKRAQS